METINNIEKITLLVSTGIVCLTNLFVMLERAKKSAKQNSNNGIQKLLGFTNTFFAVVLIILMSSCSGSKFLNRKYTSGRFIEQKKSLTHNTFYVDTTKSYTTLSSKIELKRKPTILSSGSDKEVMDKKAESIIKKDSIFIKKKNKRDSIYGRISNTDNVVVIIKSKKPLQFIKGSVANKFSIKKIKINCIVSFCLAFIPILGLVLNLTCHNRIKKYKKIFPEENIDKIKRINKIGLFISIFSLLVLIAYLIFSLIGLVNSFSSASSSSSFIHYY